MELLHCEKLRKQKMELEKAEMDLVSLSEIQHLLPVVEKQSEDSCVSGGLRVFSRDPEC